MKDDQMHQDDLSLATLNEILDQQIAEFLAELFPSHQFTPEELQRMHLKLKEFTLDQRIQGQVEVKKQLSETKASTKKQISELEKKIDDFIKYRQAQNQQKQKGLWPSVRRGLEKLRSLFTSK